MLYFSGSKSFLALIALCVWGVAFALIYGTSLQSVESQMVDSLAHKELEINQLLDIGFAYDNSIKNQVESQLKLPDREVSNPLTERLQNYPQWNAYGLSGTERVAGQPYSANLSGVGKLSEVTSAMRAEINAVLSVDLSAPFAEKKYSFIWSYYQSKSGFILLSPSVPLSEFHMRSEYFQKPYWQIATPENDPSRETVISDLYNDGAGQGMMVSISSPVYVNNDFKGIVGIDVGLDYLNHVLRSGGRPFDQYVSILTKEGQLVAGNYSVPAEGIAMLKSQPDIPHYDVFNFSARSWLVSNLLKNKFYVVYQLSRIEFLWLTLKRSSLEVLVLTLFIANLYLVFILYGAFSQTKRLSERDRLSGLYNRMMHEELSNHFFNSQTRSGEPISILMADIDHFKHLNDTKGHHAGDKGIVYVSAVIKAMSRSSDVAGRFGGEEFIVTMPNTDQQQALAVAERIRKTIEAESSIEGASLTISIGVAESHALKVFDYQALCKKADIALYSAKNNGRNRSVICTPSTDAKFDAPSEGLVTDV